MTKKGAGGRRRTRSEARPAPSASPPALPSERYLFFGGKGGGGKTTAASAAALLLLERAGKDEQILLFSTDPAHSLSDSLDARIGDQLVEVARNDASGARLLAREMNAARALDAFRARHRATLGEIAERGTLLDETDINELLDLSLPGMDEVMSLFELSEIDRTASYARIIVDTAPSGHTSRLLRLPEVFAGWIDALDRMADKHRYMVAQFARGRRAREDEVDLFLRELTERVARVRAMLFDRERAAFTLVAIPEAMSVEETTRYFALLGEEGVPVRSLIVNRIEREHDECPYCRARVASQARWLTQIAHEFESLNIRWVPLLPEEVRGPAALRRFASLAWEMDEGGALGPAADPSGTLRRKGAPRRSAAGDGGEPSAALAREKGARFTIEPRPLLIFGGKGGVGKTSAAAAAALALAEGDKEARVLVFSTDPAHSLSDSFDEQIGELKRRVAGLKNLDAMEIDPAARFEELKERYRTWTDELFESLTSGSRWEIQFDREAMRELVALAPPGIDELAALSAISDLLEDGSYTTIVLDTAPTGHLVRFLELPEIALSWVRTFIKLLLKYKDVVRWSGIAEELIALSKNIKRVAALLTAPESCEFVGVAIPERMSMEETLRLTDSLKGLKVPMRRLLINNVVPAEAAARCDFCAARRIGQQGVIKAFRPKLARAAGLFVAPQQPHEIYGPARLREHYAHWQPLPSPATEKGRPHAGGISKKVDGERGDARRRPPGGSGIAE